MASLFDSEDVIRCLQAAFDKPFESASEALRVFAESWVGLAEHCYLQHHRRLPGSLRNRRLRKKRQTKVLAWFERYLGEQ